MTHQKSWNVLETVLSHLNLKKCKENVLPVFSKYGQEMKGVLTSCDYCNVILI